MVLANNSHLPQEVVVKKEKLYEALTTIQSKAEQVAALSSSQSFRCTRWRLGPQPEIALKYPRAFPQLTKLLCTDANAQREAEGRRDSDGQLQDREDVLHLHGEEGAALGRGRVRKGPPDLPHVPGETRGVLHG